VSSLRQQLEEREREILAPQAARSAESRGRLRPDEMLWITADHGNDPTTPSTDHAREYTPLLVAGPRVRPDVDLGTRETFADVASTLAELFGVKPTRFGTSFLRQVRS